MNRLNKFLNSNLKSIKNVFIDDSSNPGEGEHKMFEYLHSFDKNNKTTTVVIHGLDADLILLSLLNDNCNIYLMRDINSFISIEELKKVIINEWKDIFHEDIIYNYCYVMSILGNDFIPHPCSLDIRNNGINILKKACINTSPVNNNEDLHNILYKLSITEKLDIDKKQYYSNTMYIYDISKACIMFLDGIQWTYNYYNKNINKIDHGWHYPFYGPPLLKDIANHSLMYNYSPLNTLETFIHSDIQLLIVIPKKSIDILPDNLKKIILEPKHGISYMYPVKFNTISFMKKFEWEHIPVLPYIDIHKMITIYNNSS